MGMALAIMFHHEEQLTIHDRIGHESAFQREPAFPFRRKAPVEVRGRGAHHALDARIVRSIAQIGRNEFGVHLFLRALAHF